MQIVLRLARLPLEAGFNPIGPTQGILPLRTRYALAALYLKVREVGVGRAQLAAAVVGVGYAALACGALERRPVDTSYLDVLELGSKVLVRAWGVRVEVSVFRVSPLQLVEAWVNLEASCEPEACHKMV